MINTPDFTTLYSALDNFIEIYEKPKIKEITLKGYERAVAVIKMNLPNGPITEYSEAQIRLFLNILPSQMNYSKSSIEKVRIILNGAFQTAYRNLHIPYTVPTSGIYIPKARTKVVKEFTREEQKKIESVCRYEYYGDMILFDLNTGLRRNELESLCKSDLDFHRKMIKIRKSKTVSGIREIPMIPLTEQILLKQIARFPYTAHVFVSMVGNTITPSAVRKMVNRMRRETGIPDFNLHRCRHTFATRLIENGLKNYAALAKLMGHSDVAFTIRQYVHTNDEELKKAIALLNDSDDIIEAKSVKDFMLCSSC